MSYDESYTGDLLAAVFARPDRIFSAEVDIMAGSWELTFNDPAALPANAFCYATPLWEGEDQGVPVQVLDDMGRELAYLYLTFKPSGDVQADALQYVHICNLIPQLLSLALARKAAE